MRKEQLARVFYECDPRNGSSQPWHMILPVFKEPYLVMAERFSKKFALVRAEHNPLAPVEDE